MRTDEGLEFVNRDEELRFLWRCLVENPSPAALVFLRGPSGVGKSSLTDRFRQERQSPDLPFFVVEPDILDSPTAPQIYQGFFLQRCAAAIDKVAATGRSSWPTFAEFLKERRWKTAREKRQHELIDELPSPESLYKQAMDYASRLLSIRHFDPNFLLESDQTYAVSLCVAFLQHALSIGPSVLLVREAQLSDVYSLKTLLGWQLTKIPVALIFEYTTESGFLPIHEKAILRTAELRGSFSLLNVVKLSFDHLEQLIRNISSDFSLSADAHLSWNGNLRSVLELKFRVGIGQQVALPADVPALLTNLERGISDHIDGLLPIQKMILAFLRANAEPLPLPVLQQRLTEVDPFFPRAHLTRFIEDLSDTHGFIQCSAGLLRLRNETIAQAVGETPSMIAFTAIAERALRDHYKDIVSKQDFHDVALAAAVRQVFRLCVLTKDVVGLVASCSEMINQVRFAQDQTIYVDAVSSAVASDPDLYHGEHEHLLMWAASLAYDTSDWQRAADIVESSRSKSTFALAMRAFALQEIGRHEEALNIANEIEGASASIEEEIIAQLIKILVRGCRGEKDFARSALVKIVEEPRYQECALTGYALRFFDMVDGLTDALPRLEASVAWFDKAGLSKARAYSELPTAMLFARLGRSTEAGRLITRAQEVLDLEIRDQHIVFNNAAAVELLSDNPNAPRCIELLSQALHSARDDFSELTIITNLSLARWLNGEIEAATNCAMRMLDILGTHDFVDREIFWPVCFNAIRIFTAAKRSADCEAALFLLDENKILSQNQKYWDYCFGSVEAPPQEYKFLAEKSIHPVYLNHWTVELEGLSLLKKESRL
jgi:tetratricopeptide (TPR) repeat protein